ncbi:MAG: hypothetical protein PHV55_08725 [Candidatus Omnitrophica bacterium]|nr:hypothetical protein [Candidatus Omnitrophota bacterium]
MSTPLFIRQFRDKPHIALHKSLYDRKFIEAAMKEEPDFVLSVKSKGGYYLLELREADYEDCLRFLDFMTYLRRIDG